MPQSLSLRPGCAYSFQYPCHDHVGLPDRTERRRIVVETVRDTSCEPLDPTKVVANPARKHGPWLVIGRDLDCDDVRSFDSDSMTQVEVLSELEREPLRYAIYIVLTPVGRPSFYSARLGEAITFLLERRNCVLCKVLGRASELGDFVPAA